MKMVPEIIGLEHLKYLTDDFGIWQHTNESIINKEHGYALDDSARALLVATQYNEPNLVNIYINFIERAISDGSPKNIVNFFDSNRLPIFEKSWSEDAIGQSYWALALCIEKGIQKERVLKLIAKIEPIILKLHHLRSISYALIGAVILNETLTFDLAKRLFDSFKDKHDDDWYWPEKTLTYANAIIPYALLKAGQFKNIEKENAYTETGLQALRFLNNVKKENGIPIVIGNRGWYTIGGKKALFDQQPVDVSYMILANVLAYEITHEYSFIEEALTYFSWFWGNNLLEASMIIKGENSVLDGLQEDGPSQNRGAENIVCYLLAQKAIEPYLISSGRL